MELGPQVWGDITAMVTAAAIFAGLAVAMVLSVIFIVRTAFRAFRALWGRLAG